MTQEKKLVTNEERVERVIAAMKRGNDVAVQVAYDTMVALRDQLGKFRVPVRMHKDIPVGAYRVEIKEFERSEFIFFSSFEDIEPIFQA